MLTKNDPKELKGFSSMDDRPDNNGSYLDEERLNPLFYDDDFGKENDDWEDEYDRVNPERYD